MKGATKKELKLAIFISSCYSRNARYLVIRKNY